MTEIKATLLEAMGSDASIAAYTRMCTGGFDPEGFHVPNQVRDARTIVRLIRDGHTSPFEFADATFYVACPIYVMRQVVRHRTASILERSLRYCLAPDGLSPDVQARYRERLDAGDAPEQARVVLPLDTPTEAIWKMDLRNLLRFLRLRQDAHAQAETRQLADQIADAVAEWVPLTWAAWTEATDAERGRF